MIEVSAGIIRRGDGKILVCQRGEGRANAHLWEFPGGKRENGEDAASCLQRELLEELALPVRNVQTVCTRQEGNISFTFLSCETDAVPVATEHEDIRFVTPREMLALPFCPADTVVAVQLALQSVKTFLWDFDGTLADTYPGLTAAFAAACEANGVHEDPARLLRLLKKELPFAMQTITEEHHLPDGALKAAYTEARKRIEDPTSMPPIHGMPELVKKLSANGAVHYLVTHRDIAAMDTIRAWGLDFAGHMLRDDPGFVRKPSPDGILYLFAQEHIDPATAMMIGDRPLDIDAGHAAGAITCLLDTENRFPDQPCDVRIASAQELEDLLFF